MGALEQINQLRSQGMSDSDITNRLRESGFSPKDINDAFNQAHIKMAVSDDSNNSDDGVPAPSSQSGNQEDVYTPQSTELPSQQDTYYPETQGGYSQYQQGGDYSSGGGYDSSTIIEVSEEVFSEKVQPLQKKIDEVSEFKSLAESKMENMNERLKKIEKMIDSLQISILQKVGSYGDNLNGIKKEMGMMQDSFKKMVNPIAARYAEKSAKKTEGKKPTTKTKTKKSSKKK